MATAAFTLVIELSTRLRTAVALVAVEMSALAGTVRVEPPNERFNPVRVMFEDPSALAMKPRPEVSDPSSRLEPLKLAAWIVWVMRCRVD